MKAIVKECSEHLFHNNKNLETTQMSIHFRMDTVELNTEKKQTTDTRWVTIMFTQVVIG